MDKAAEFYKTKLRRINGELRQNYVVSILEDGDITDEGDAYTSEKEGFQVLRWKADDAVIESDVMDIARGATFGEQWPFLSEMEQARKG